MCVYTQTYATIIILHALVENSSLHFEVQHVD
jgi:hypothetical protein